MRSKTTRALWAAMLGVSIATAAWSAPPKKRATSADPVDADALSPESLAKLRSEDMAQVQAGLDDARLVGPKARPAVPVIVELLQGGLPYPVAEAALATLGDLQAVEGPGAIAPYTHHRDVKVRRAAVRALAKPPSGQGAGPALAIAASALEAALADPDPSVRATAATGLGSLHASGAVPALFLALDRRVYEAAVSLGQLCERADCDAFVAKLGKVPFDVMTTGLDPLLSRPASEVGDDEKVAVVAKVRDLGTRDAHRFLQELQGRWAKGGGASSRVKRELDAAVLATLSSPGGAL